MEKVRELNNQFFPAGNVSILNGVVPVIGNIINMGPGSSISATGKGFLGGLRGGVNTVKRYSPGNCCKLMNHQQSILCMDCAATCKQFDYSYTDNTWGGRRGGSIAGNIVCSLILRLNQLN